MVSNHSYCLIQNLSFLIHLLILSYNLLHHKRNKDQQTEIFLSHLNRSYIQQLQELQYKLVIKKTLQNQFYNLPLYVNSGDIEHPIPV
jgi:hypothetical protein